MEHMTQSDDYARIETAIRFIEEHHREQPDLDEIARQVHLSKFHFDRLFRRWAGVSPKRFLQYVTLEYAKGMLQAGNLQAVALEAGLSGTARLHDLFVTIEAMTPGEYRNGGSGLSLRYGVAATPFGDCLVAWTERGLCHLGFVPQNGFIAELNTPDLIDLTGLPSSPNSDNSPGLAPDLAAALDALKARWPAAALQEDAAGAEDIAARIFVPDARTARPFHLHLKGTNFQIQVWKALLQIPEGWVASYEELAGFMGNPKAFRAVASAVAANPVGFLIPCHRVIRKSGEAHNYRWGHLRKKAILAWEAARNTPAA
jgi:AraC family transcriptional regulator of adaptative response/methylated-DNA-[protein]-cysteine methyltransferase